MLHCQTLLVQENVLCDPSYTSCVTRAEELSGYTATASWPHFALDSQIFLALADQTRCHMLIPVWFEISYKYLIREP